MKKKEYLKQFKLILFIKVMKHNIVSILTFTFAFITLGIIYLNAFVKTTYQSSGRLDNQKALYPTLVNTMRTAFLSDFVINQVETNLIEQSVLHGNGNAITKVELQNGLIVPTSSDSAYITISFRSQDKKIVKPTLEVIFDVAIEYIANQTNHSDFNKLKVFDEPSEPVDISNNKQKILIFGFLGLTLSYCISFIVDYKYDLVYEINDVIDLNTNVLELNYTERKQEKNE